MIVRCAQRVDYIYEFLINLHSLTVVMIVGEYRRRTRIDEVAHRAGGQRQLLDHLFKTVHILLEELAACRL